MQLDTYLSLIDVSDATRVVVEGDTLAEFQGKEQGVTNFVSDVWR
jgi:hypothetical protein